MLISLVVGANNFFRAHYAFVHLVWGNVFGGLIGVVSLAAGYGR